MNRQMAFDKSASSLLKQNEKSFYVPKEDGEPDGPELLAYRGFNGKRCAIGWLIDDTKHSEAIEDLTCEEHAVLEVIDSKYGWIDMLANDHTFLLDIQQIHDLNEPEDWRGLFATLAEDYRLNANVLEQAA